MNKEYHNTYKSLYANYVNEINQRKGRYTDEEGRILFKIIESINNADKENQLRPDAKYFLAVNFHHLIIKPLIIKKAVYSYMINWIPPKLIEDINNDIGTIISQSRKNNINKEISGHQIMRSIDILWKDLNVTKLGVWG